MGRLIRLTPRVLELVEGIEVGAVHLQLGLDLQAGAGAGGLDDVEAAPGHAEVHVFAVADFDMDPVYAGFLQLFDCGAEDGIVGPEEAGGNFALGGDLADGVCHW